MKSAYARTKYISCTEGTVYQEGKTCKQHVNAVHSIGCKVKQRWEQIQTHFSHNQSNRDNPSKRAETCYLVPVQASTPSIPFVNKIQVNAVHSIPHEDVVITSSSLGPSGPHVLTVWDLPTEEERSSEKQFLPALTYRQETPTRQVSTKGITERSPIPTSCSGCFGTCTYSWSALSSSRGRVDTV